jgi:hypothetical protein
MQSYVFKIPIFYLHSRAIEEAHRAQYPLAKKSLAECGQRKQVGSHAVPSPNNVEIAQQLYHGKPHRLWKIEITVSVVDRKSIKCP